MPNLVSIQVTAVSVIMGSTISLQATGLYDDSSQQDISSQVTWSVVSQNPDPSNTGINLLTINPGGQALTPTASGAVNGGSAQVSATLNGISGTGTVTIVPLTITA